MDCTTCQNYKPIEIQPTYKVGDKVKVIGNGSAMPHHHSIGSVGKIAQVKSLAVTVNGMWQFVDANDIEPYIEPPEPYTEPSTLAQEKPSEFYNGKVVCIDDKGFTDFWTTGKVYTFKNGICKANKGNVSPLLGQKNKDLSQINKDYPGMFIPFLGEQSC